MISVYTGWIWMGVFSVLFIEAVIYAVWQMGKETSIEYHVIEMERVRKAYDQEKDGCPRIPRKSALWH